MQHKWRLGPSGSPSRRRKRGTGRERREELGRCVRGGEKPLLLSLLQGVRASSRLAREVRGRRVSGRRGGGMRGPVGEWEGACAGQWERGGGGGEMGRRWAAGREEDQDESERWVKEGNPSSIFI